MICANITVPRTAGSELAFMRARNSYEHMNRARAKSSGQKYEILGRERKKDKWSIRLEEKDKLLKSGGEKEVSLGCELLLSWGSETPYDVHI